MLTYGSYHLLHLSVPFSLLLLDHVCSPFFSYFHENCFSTESYMLQPKSDQFPVLFEGTDRDPVLFCPAPDGRWIRLLPHKLTGSSPPPSYSLSLIFSLLHIFFTSDSLSRVFPLPLILAPSYSTSPLFSLPHIVFPSYSRSLIVSFPHVLFPSYSPLSYSLSLMFSLPHILSSTLMSNCPWRPWWTSRTWWPSQPWWVNEWVC